MRASNTLRSVIFAVAAIFIIFYQDHSVGVGMAVLQFVTVALVLGGVSLYKIAKVKVSLRDFATPVGLAFIVAALTVVLAGDGNNQLMVFRALVILFALGMAVLEFVLSFKAKPEDVLELRIASGIGLSTGLVFLLAPLDDVNAVGFLSAYLAISAAQRAIWAASPTKMKAEK